MEALQLSELSWQAPGKHLHRVAHDCETHSLYPPTRISLCVSIPQAWVQKGNWSSAHAESRGKRGGQPRMEMSTVGWWYNSHRGLWLGRSRGQDIKVMDWRMPKLMYPSHSLPHIAHVNHVTKLGVRVGVEEMRLKGFTALV